MTHGCSSFSSTARGRHRRVCVPGCTLSNTKLPVADTPTCAYLHADELHLPFTMNVKQVLTWLNRMRRKPGKADSAWSIGKPARIAATPSAARASPTRTTMSSALRAVLDADADAVP